MERERAIRMLQDFAEAKVAELDYKSRQDLRDAIRDSRKPTTKWSHMEAYVDALLGDPEDVEVQSERQEAWAILMGALFPEWETGDYTADQEFRHWLWEATGLVQM